MGIIILIGVYLISVIFNYLIYKNILRREKRVKFDNDERGIIFIPLVNTISLIVELWDRIFEK